MTPGQSHDPFEEDARAFRRLFPESAPAPTLGRTLLVLDRGSTGYIRYEIYLYRVLQRRGFSLVAIGWRLPDVVRYYDLLGIPYHYWDEFMPQVDPQQVSRLLSQCSSVEEIKQLERNGVRLGLHAFAECLRWNYLEGDKRDLPGASTFPAGLDHYIRHGLQAIPAAETIVDTFKPESVLFGDALYTLQGTFLDVALARGIGAIKVLPALEDDTLYMKRYTGENRDWPYTSLSTAIWQRLLAAEWDEGWSRAFHQRHRDAYDSGAWYSLQALTKKTVSATADRTRERLGLSGGKPVAVVVPHLIWDTPVYGQNLFADHGSWLVAVVKAALDNENVDWIIKLHPANMFSVNNEDYMASTVFAETVLLEQAVGALKPHVRLLMPDTDVNTYSLLQIADFCLTETGTAGIEAAAMGVTVLTGGRSHYSERGFTVDSRTADELIERLRYLQHVSRISKAQQALAERFAYASFYAKPFHLTSLSVRFPNATNAAMQVEVMTTDGGRFVEAADMRALVGWLGEADDDYINAALLPPLRQG